MSIAWRLFSFNGRIARLTFWIIFIPCHLIGFFLDASADKLVDYIDRTSYDSPQWALVMALAMLLIGILLLWITFAALTKRLHDRNKSAKWLILAVIPIIGWMWVVWELGCLPGTDDANRFGPAPSQPHDPRDRHPALRKAADRSARRVEDQSSRAALDAC